MSRLRWYPPLVVALLIGVQIVVFTSPLTYAGWFIPAAAVVIAILGRVTGLSWDDLGLSPRTMPTGLRYAVVIVVIVAVVAAGAVALPWTRELFHNDSYPDVPAAIYAALVLIPLRTVLAEEVIFRGALLGSLARLTSARVALAGQAALFGCWHVASSLGLAAHNDGIGDIVGTGSLGVVAGVLIAVVVTGGAGLLLGWLRMRSGSLLAPIALHWSVNGIGAIAAAIAWQLN
ncbi:CPBP family intramembrane glutamic endopeptidase [Gordonia sp. VNQ95]|uniref:CPBP family intramembrane glutamic endopeptidase n=1 Tax=Gordonia sp. VNQ95 TaxID=3156619 RepID=UPI0032B57BFD